MKALGFDQLDFSDARPEYLISICRKGRIEPIAQRDAQAQMDYLRAYDRLVARLQSRREQGAFRLDLTELVEFRHDTRPMRSAAMPGDALVFLDGKLLREYRRNSTPPVHTIHALTRLCKKRGLL